MTPEESARFFRFIPDNLPESECWLWLGGNTSEGYARFCLADGRRGRAHKLLFEFLNGPVIPGNVVRHLCHVRNCVNPSHLAQGTQKQNMQDTAASGNVSSKLTEEEVKEIRNLYGSKEKKVQELAEKYYVSQAAIYKIVNRKTWQHC